MKKLWLFTALALAALSLFSGGTDTADINRMIFVTGIGIDRSGENYNYTFYTAVPTGSDTAVGDNNVEYKPVTVTGDRLAQAVRSLEMNSSRSVSFEHLNCCAIGTSLTEEHLPTLLDYLLRNPCVRRQSALLTLDCSAEEFFSMEYTGSIASAAASLLELQDDSPGRRSIVTLGRLDSAAQAGSGYCLYILDIAKGKSGPSSTDAYTPSSMALKGLAVYSSDGLGGRLTAQQAELARLFTDGQSSGVIVAADEHGSRCFYEIRTSVCRTDFRTGIPPVGRFNIEIDCVPVEAENDTGKFPSDELLARSLYSQLDELLELSRTYGSAFTGLEAEARQSDSQWYRQHSESWEEIYQNTLLQLDVKCRTADSSE